MVGTKNQALGAARVRAPERPLRYLPALDGIRCLAALAVILGHAGSFYPASPRLLAQGGLLVITFLQIFFITSGFLIYRPLVAKIFRSMAPGSKRIAAGPGRRSGHTSFFGFVGRRFLRIFPLYWAVLAAKCFLQGAGDVHGLTDWIQIIFLFPFPNPDVLAGGGLGFAMWTLAIELPFYVLLPLYANGTRLIQQRLLRGWSTLAVQLTCVGTLMGLIVGMAIWFGSIELVALLPLPLGMVVGILEVHQWTEGRRMQFFAWLGDRWWLCLGLFMVCWQIGAFVSYQSSKGTQVAAVAITSLVSNALLMLVGILALFVTFCFGRPSYLSWLFSSWPFRVLAPLTYGTYLWHPMVLKELADRYGQGLWVLMLGTLVVSVLASLCTSIAVEAPLVRFRKRVDAGKVEGTPRPAAPWTLPWLRSPA